MPRRRLVTLTTDIGAVYAAQMKAVLYQRLPPGHVIDLVHDVTPHRIEEAAFLLRHMGAMFPPGTVHIAVVDPGVGSARAPVVVECADGSLLVGPDNGVLQPLSDRLGGGIAYRLDPARVTPGRRPSPTFEGRDLFAPAAARLATGTPARRLGRRFSPRPYSLPAPRRRGATIQGVVLHIDHFGNLITNVPGEWLPPEGRRMAVRLGRGAPRSLPRARTYADLAPRRLGILVSSFGTAEVSAREDSASRRLGARPGMALTLRGPVTDVREVPGPVGPERAVRVTSLRLCPEALEPHKKLALPHRNSRLLTAGQTARPEPLPISLARAARSRMASEGHHVTSETNGATLRTHSLMYVLLRDCVRLQTRMRTNAARHAYLPWRAEV